MPIFTKDMQEAAINTLNNEMLVGGESVNKFEDEFARYVRTDYAVSVNSGSSALLLAFYALNLEQGDKVVAPSATFIATLNGPSLLGGIPLFCEIGEDYLLSTKSLRDIVKYNDIKYLIPVHLYGYPCDMDEINDIVRQNKNITIVEDAAQGHGAKYRRKKVGSFGEAAIFSFYPTKNMTVGGDGGMVTTNNKKIYDSVLKLRDVGRRTKYTHDEIGYTLRLNSVNAAIGKIQLGSLDLWNDKRRSLAKKYDDSLKDIGDLVLPPSSNNCREAVYHMYVIRTQYRNELGAWLWIKGISTGVHYPLPVHQQPAYKMYQNGARLEFTDKWSRTVLSIPMHPNLHSKDQQYIIDMIQKFYNENMYNIDKIKIEAKAWSAKLI